MNGKLLAAVFAALVAAACSGPTDPSKNQTKVFEGRVQPQSFGDETHTFEISNTGEIQITVNSITPGNVFLGVLYGQMQGGNCGPIQQTTVGNLSIGRTNISGQIFIKGTYCLVMFDPTASIGIAPLTVAQNYRVTVSHP